MERTVITFSAENIITVFLMVAGTSAALGLMIKAAHSFLGHKGDA